MFNKLIYTQKSTKSVDIQLEDPVTKKVVNEMRIIFEDDGTFRLISNFKSKQVIDIPEKYRDYTRVVEHESFGYPEN